MEILRVVGSTILDSTKKFSYTTRIAFEGSTHTFRRTAHTHLRSRSHLQVLADMNLERSIVHK